MTDVLSKLLGAVRPHSRLRAQSSAYVDGELGPAAHRRFEAHLAGCEECTLAVDASRAVKALLAAVPMEEAPRSFRLTPQMVSAPVTPVQRPRSAAPLRLAQVTTALAAFALLTVVTVGAFAGSSSDSTATMALDSALSSNESKAASTPAAGGAVTRESPRSQVATASGAAPGAAVTGQAVEAPAPPQTGAQSSAPGAPPLTAAPSTSNAFADQSATALGDAVPAEADSRPGSSDARNRPWLELTLLTVIVAAGAAWFGLSRHTRRRES